MIHELFKIQNQQAFASAKTTAKTLCQRGSVKDTVEAYLRRVVNIGPAEGDI